MEKQPVQLLELPVDLSDVDEQAWYSTYSATSVLLFVVHILYLNQVWGQKLSQQHFLLNYNRIIQRKKFHLVVGAILTHSPANTQANTASTNTPHSLQDESTTSRRTSANTSTNTNTMRRFMIVRSGDAENMSPALGYPIRQIVHRLRAFGVAKSRGSWKKQSGLPLLFYCSYLLWSCRALEVVCGSGWEYARFLWVLTWTGLALDLGFTYMALTTLRKMNYGTSAAFATGLSFWSTSGTTNLPVARQVEHSLLERSIGSLTMTTCAVLFVFRDLFDVPFSIIPFLWTDLPVLGTPIFSYSLVLALLLLLSHPMHPIAGVVCGTLAGVLWTSGWITFLVEAYWLIGSIFLYAALSLLAYKANNASHLPCIDFVPWNHRGDFSPGPDASNHYHQSTSRMIPYDTLDGTHAHRDLHDFEDDKDDDDNDYITRFREEDDISTENSVVEAFPFSTDLPTRDLQQAIPSSSLNYMAHDDDGEHSNPEPTPDNGDTTQLAPSTNPPANGLGPTRRSRRPLAGLVP